MICNPLSEQMFRNDIDEYLKIQFANFKSDKVSGPKVIHDSVHGTNVFKPHEVALLDLPIIQRLRRISQTDVSSYVFPAGNHNRFEHTLGVTVVAGQMVNALYLNGKKGTPTEIEYDYVYEHCRVAAILHDCGHGPFSHLSEQIYGAQFDVIKKSNTRFGGASPHEIMSYLIVTSPVLKDYFETTIEKYYNIYIDLDLVGDMIIGYVDKTNNKSKGFIVEIINGAFDADKLDYILRDAHSTGIQMAVDLPRLMYTLDVLQDIDGVSRLAIDISGVSALEEIVFNKMMLTSTIYHHQKVRATGCLLKSIFIQCESFNKATDYLKYTDDQVYNISSINPAVTVFLNMLKTRKIPKRAFCFSNRTIVTRSELHTVMKTLQSEEFLQDIIQNISIYAKNEFGEDIPADRIWIDSPQEPKFKEATLCVIKCIGAANDYVTLRDVFPTDDWVRAFSENKWQGYVYTMPEYCETISKASKAVFESIFDTEFNDYATKLCKID